MSIALKRGALLMLATLIASCAGKPERHGYVSDYQQAIEAAGLEAFDPATLPPHARRFFDYLDGFSAAMVARDTESVYAPEAYLNDTLKTVRGNGAIREYFAETFERVVAVEADVVEVAGSGRSWFYRWRMSVTFEDLNKGRPLESIGVSHIVFDEQGQVLIHQDYWDAASHFFSVVPLAGKVIDKVKDRL